MKLQKNSLHCSLHGDYRAGSRPVNLHFLHILLASPISSAKPFDADSAPRHRIPGTLFLTSRQRVAELARPCLMSDPSYSPLIFGQPATGRARGAGPGRLLARIEHPAVPDAGQQDRWRSAGAAGHPCGEAKPTVFTDNLSPQSGCLSCKGTACATPVTARVVKIGQGY
jgi:hypothetical protein